MFSPRRAAHLGLLSAAIVLALSVTVLLRGSASLPASDESVASTDAGQQQPRPALASNQLLLGTPTAHR